VIGDQELAFVIRDIGEYHARIAHRHTYELARFAIHENCALIPVLELEIAITSQDFVRVWIIVLETIVLSRVVPSFMTTVCNAMIARA